VVGGPGGSSGPGGGSTGFATGEVTSISGDTLVLTGISSLDAPKPSKAGKAGKTGGKTEKRSFAGAQAPKPSKVTVSLTSTTTYTETQPATSAALAVGDCVTAAGSTSTNGSVAASTVRIVSTGQKSCTAGPGTAFVNGGAPVNGSGAVNGGASFSESAGG